MTATTQTTVERIEAAINEMSQHQLVSLNNRYGSEVLNCGDHDIYSNDEEFFATFFGEPGKAMEALRAAHFGDYKYHHDWVRFNGYGNLESMSHVTTDDLCEAVSVMAEYIAQNPDGFDALFDAEVFESDETETE